MQIALAKFRWRTAPAVPATGWYPPLVGAGHRDSVDLRAVPLQGARGVLDGDLGGWALMAFDDGVTLPAEAISLGADDALDSILPASTVLAIKTALGVMVVGPSVTTRTAMLRFLTTLADPTGATAVKPLRAGEALWLAGLRIGTA